MTEQPAPPAAPERQAPWGLLALVAAVFAVVAFGVAAIAVARHDSNRTTRFTARDIAATQQVGQACQQWFGTSSTARGDVPSSWCGHMTDWMYDQMTSGRPGQMMWGSPQTMQDACVQAMSAYAQAPSDPTAWCQSMVTWMTQQAVGPNGWMTGGSMMGGR